MPDWSYATLSGPMLRRMSHDRGRRFVNGFFSAAARIPQGFRIVDFLGHMVPDAQLAVELPTGRSVASPVVLVPCIDPRGRGAAAFSRFGAGMLAFGPVSVGVPTEPTFAQREQQAITSTGGAALSLEEARCVVDQTGSAAFLFELDPFDSADDPMAALTQMARALGKRAACLVLSPQVFSTWHDDPRRDALFAELSDICREHGAVPMLGVPTNLALEQMHSLLEELPEDVALYISGAPVDEGWQWGGATQREAALELTRAVREADVERRGARRERDRVRRLHTDGFASQVEFDRAEFALERLAAAHSRANADAHRVRTALERSRRQRLERTISAPFDGVIARLHVDVGDSISARSPLVRVLESSTPMVAFAIEQDALRPALGTPVVVETTDGSRHWSATVASVQPDADPRTGLVAVQAEFEDANAEECRHAMAVVVRPDR